jgi:hypothetical protein
LLILLYYLGDAFGQKKMLGYPRDDTSAGFTGFLKSLFWKHPQGDWSIRGSSRPNEHTGSRRVRCVLAADQSHHSPDPKTDFPRYPPNANAP